MVDIIVSYNADPLKGTMDALHASGLDRLLGSGSGIKVSLKPNMVLAKHPSYGATTHPEVVEGVIRYLKEFGVSKIEIIEGAWVGGDTKQAYRVCGYEDLSKKYAVPLYDLKDDKAVTADAGGIKLKVCAKAMETDFLINIPVLKAHCQTLMTCCLKNLKGCIPDSEKRRYHTLGLHRPIALLNTVLKTGFCVIDGICGDLTFEEGGTPVARNTILAGRDPLLLDSYCAGQIGYLPDEIEYLGIARELGVGKIYGSDTKLLELNSDNKPKLETADKGAVSRLSHYINEDQACSACYSALVFALQKTGAKPREGICIGQGFKGKEAQSTGMRNPYRLGCGDCARGCGKYVSGCPPTAADIAKFLCENN